MVSDALSARCRHNQASSEWIGGQIETLSIKASSQLRLAGAAFHVSLSHHMAITCLVENEQNASACALLRPQMDAYIRGLWLAHLATQEEVAAVVTGSDPPPTPKILKMLEDSGRFAPQTITRIGEKTWPALCDFTHTGIRTLISHLDEEGIGANFRDRELLELLAASDAWAHLATVGIAELADDNALALAVFERSKAQT